MVGIVPCVGDLGRICCLFLGESRNVAELKAVRGKAGTFCGRLKCRDKLSGEQAKVSTSKLINKNY
jgi:hypothetical protein